MNALLRICVLGASAGLVGSWLGFQGYPLIAPNPFVTDMNVFTCLCPGIVILCSVQFIINGLRSEV